MVIEEDPAAIVLNKVPGLATQGGTKTKEHVDGLLGGLVVTLGSKRIDASIRTRLNTLAQAMKA